MLLQDGNYKIPKGSAFVKTTTIQLYIHKNTKHTTEHMLMQDSTTFEGLIEVELIHGFSIGGV